jgi:hypothetical protein
VRNLAPKVGNGDGHGNGRELKDQLNNYICITFLINLAQNIAHL